MVVVQQQMQFLKEDCVPFRIYDLTNNIPHTPSVAIVKENKQVTD